MREQKYMQTQELKQILSFQTIDLIYSYKIRKKGKITLIEVEVTNQDILHTLETEKNRKHDILANEIKSIYNAKVKIIPIFMTWDGMVTTYHKKYLKEIRITNSIHTIKDTKEDS